MSKKMWNSLGNSPAIRHVSALLFQIIAVYGLYVQVHGDYSPGGGFQGGVIVASAVVLYSALLGLTKVTRVISLGLVDTMCAVGLLIYIATGLVSIFVGNNFLSYLFFISDSVTEQKLGIFLVELGVGITVFGSMVSIYFDFASRGK